MNMNYLEWINQCTPTRWWHDSGNPDEIELALKRGATGVTTNPVLTFRSFQSQPDFWNPKVPVSYTHLTLLTILQV